MSKYKAPAPELTGALEMIPTDAPRGVVVRLTVQPDRLPGRVHVWWEVAQVTWEGRYLPAYRFGESVSRTSDAILRGAIYRGAARLRLWWDEQDPAELYRLVAWQAGAHDLASRAPKLQ